MRDSQHGGAIERSVDELSALARTVAARLAARGGRVSRSADLELVATLVRAIVSPDLAEFEALRRGMRKARIVDAELVDIYFPAIARLLGNDWLDDRLSWVDVTIGMARLQALLHQIGLASAAPVGPGAPSVLIVLPEGEQHAFGAQVLAVQLRRQGIAVHLQIGARPERLRALVRERHFDCALVSVACKERLEFCRKVVKSLHDGSLGQLWVTIGGAVLDQVSDARLLTGADAATNDPFEALSGAGRAGTGDARREAASAEAAGSGLMPQ